MTRNDETAIGRSIIDEGQGDPVVLVHSSASSNRQWRTLVQRLAPHYRVIAPNLCGYDGAPSNTQQLSFDDDCRRVRNVLGMASGPVHLAGHSYGGLLAIKTAIDDPARIRSLTLIEPVCFHLLQEAGDDAALTEIAAVRDDQKTNANRGDIVASAKGFIDYWMGPEAWPAMPDDRKTAVAATMQKVAAEWPGAFTATTCLAQYRALPWPTLLVRAADTTLAASRTVVLIHGQMETAELIEIERGGHMSPVTNPEPVNAAIAAFLERTG